MAADMKADALGSRIRPPAVAGLFYPASAGELGSSVDALLAARPAKTQAPKALIVPHAGYIFSGPVAASAYGLLGAVAGGLRRVVILGPSHRHWFRGVAIPAAKAFATPLGELQIDQEAVEKLTSLPEIVVSDEPHSGEHSLEVQLPFLQRISPNVQIVPMVVGDASASEVASVIDAVWGGAETLIVVSSDLSHYHRYGFARAMDSATARAILDGRDDLSGDQACGCLAVNGLVRVARRRGLRCELLDIRNSGDTAGDKQRVVGYAAFGFYDA